MTNSPVRRRRPALPGTVRSGSFAVARAAICVLFLAVCAASLSPAAAQTFRFDSVTVEGNARVDAGTVLAQARVPRGTALSAGELNDAFQRLAGSGLYETVAFEPRGSTLLIRIEERPVVGRISIEGNRRLDDEELLALVTSSPRRVYDPATAEADAAAIADAYEARGRLAASVTPKIIRRTGGVVDLVFEIAEGRTVETERVSFVGNRAFSDRRLRRVLDTKQAGLLRQFIARDTFVPDRIEFDKQLLSDFYASRGYIDFQVLSANSEFARDRSAFFVTFNIREGQSYTINRVTASSDLPDVNAAEFAAVSRLRTGQRWSPAAIDSTIQRMERLAIRKGLNFVRADPEITRNQRDLTLDLNFRLVRGPRIFVERIDIEGNATTLDRVVRRQFDVVEGDPFNPRQIRETAERIRALGFFSNADVETREGTAADQIIVDVDVEEQPTGTLTFGASYSADDGPGLNAGFSERNFLGRGQTLRLNVTTGTSAASSRFSFIEPSFLSRDLRFQFDAFYIQTDRSEAFYDTRVVGFSPSFTFPVSQNGRLTLTYRVSEDTISGLDFGDPDDADDNGSSPILQREEGTAITSVLGYSYSYDTRRTGLNPNAGVLLRFGQDFAGIGGDTEYIETSALALAQTRVLNDEVTLRATIEGGVVNSIGDGETRVIDRFFLSSDQLRGFAPLGLGPRDLNATNEDALGGNAFAVARLEAEFPLGLPEEYGIAGGVFVDAGSVWSLDDTAGADGVEVDDGFSLRVSTGVSLFWDTPIGPLRFNFAKAVQKEEYDDERIFNLTVTTEF